MKNLESIAPVVALKVNVKELTRYELVHYAAEKLDAFLTIDFEDVEKVNATSTMPSPLSAWRS